MPKTIIQDTDASGVLQFAGAGAWATSTDYNTSGNTYHVNYSIGAAAYVNIAAGSGFTGACFTTIATYAPAVVAVQIDTQAPTTWTIWNGGGADGNAPNEYQATFGKIAIPNDGAAHTLAISLVSGTSLIIDTVELYVSEPSQPGRMIAVGNSIGQGIGTSVALSGGAGISGSSYYPNGCISSTALRLGMTLGPTQSYNFSINGAEIHTATPVITAPAWQTLMAGGAGLNYWDDYLPSVAFVMFGYNGCRSQDPQRWGSTAALIASAQSYHLTMFVRRIADLLARMALRCPTASVLVCGIGYASTTYAGYGWQQSGSFTYAGDFNKGWPDASASPTTPRNIAGAWNDALRTLISNRTLYPNVTYVDTVQDLIGAGPYVSGTNPGALYDATHPNDYGAGVIAEKLARVARAVHGGGSGRRGGAY